MSIFYPAQFEESFITLEGSMNEDHYVSDGYTITFRDVPEAITQGVDFIESVDMANDALKCSMEFYTERGEDYPVPSKPQQGDIMIEFIDPNSKPEDFIINYKHNIPQNVYLSE